MARAERKVNDMVLQLIRSEDMGRVRRRLEVIIAERGLELEVRDFVEQTPMYKQALGMFDSIFGFIATIMGVVVLFTVVNTMSMSVMERTIEIGTARAMGVRRSGIRRRFLVEGALPGSLGASAGILLGRGIGTAVNQAGLT
jgi:putative ABC transport system permease protein